ncbi:hypothetical protein PG984_009731 [Apiospora sp. TS-2023a]
MTFIMESWYWELENATVWETNSRGPLLQGIYEYNNTKLLTNFTGVDDLWQVAIPKFFNSSLHSAIPFTFEATTVVPLSYHNSLDVSYIYGSKNQSLAEPTVRLEALLVQKHVNLNVSCTVLSCNVTNLQSRNEASEYDSAGDRNYLLKYLFPHFRGAFQLEHSGSPKSGVLEAYLYDPSQNPYNVLNEHYFDIGLTNVSAEDLGRRLTQVLNAYWIVDNQFLNAAGGFNGTSDRYWSLQSKYLRNSTVTIANYQDFLLCDNGWAAILCISSIMLLLAALASAILSFFRLAPDCTDFLSALTLHDGRLMLEGGSSMDEYERVRLLKDVRLKVGDVRSWEQVGQTLIAQDGHVGDLRKKPIYW